MVEGGNQAHLEKALPELLLKSREVEEAEEAAQQISSQRKRQHRLVAVVEVVEAAAAVEQLLCQQQRRPRPAAAAAAEGVEEVVQLVSRPQLQPGPHPLMKFLHWTRQLRFPRQKAPPVWSRHCLFPHRRQTLEPWR